MAQALAKIEPLKLPDIRRPGNLPSLPEWVASRLESLQDRLQRGPEGPYRNVSTLPAEMLLAEDQKRLITSHAASLRQMAEATPQTSADAEAATLVVVTKLLMSKPSQRGGELDAEARGEAYMAALDDVPTWAVAEAVRKWHRGDCGPKHDYRWCPDSASLRQLAQIELWRVLGRASELERLASAERRIEYSEEYCANMRQKLSDLMHRITGADTAPEPREQA